jgi:hypothetical protein
MKIINCPVTPEPLIRVPLSKCEPGKVYALSTPLYHGDDPPRHDSGPRLCAKRCHGTSGHEEETIFMVELDSGHTSNWVKTRIGGNWQTIINDHECKYVELPEYVVCKE